jgi:hypothetical protein
MTILSVFFEFSENKRLFVCFPGDPASEWVPVSHKVWYTVFINAPDMVLFFRNRLRR